MNTKLTRREALQMGAAATIPMLGAFASGNAAAEKSPVPATIGMSTLGFGTYTNSELAAEFAANGIQVIQLFLSQKDSSYWVYNGRNDVSTMNADRCKEIAQTYASAGIAIHSIGVYTNLIHADAEERKANLAYFDAMFRIGAEMGVKAFITEAGHYDPPETSGGVPHHFREDVWAQMVNTGKELAAMAEHYDATVLYEPFYRGFLASAKRMRLFLEDIGSSRARALLDPANLIEINDLEEMFTQLAPFIDCFHAKDRKLHVDSGVAAGQGDLDYVKFVALAGKYAPHAPFILEYVGPQDYLQALQVLQNAMKP